jgi:hypothetical protein
MSKSAEKAYLWKSNVQFFTIETQIFTIEISKYPRSMLFDMEPILLSKHRLPPTNTKNVEGLI